MKGSMAIGSRRTTPTAPVAAAVVSEPMVAPTYTPCIQLNAWNTSGMVRLRRPPKMIAFTGTPLGSPAAGSSTGLLLIGAVKRLLGCAALLVRFGVHSLPCQSIALAGLGQSLSSHQTSYVPSSSGTSATLVKI